MLKDRPSSQATAATIARLARLWPVLLVVILILFPFGWLGELWPDFGLWLGWVFATAREHAIGHALLFFSLGLLALLSIPALRRRPPLYLTLLIVAFGQEGFQLLYKQRPLVFDDGRDLVTDVVGLAAAFAVVWVWRWYRRREKEHS